MKHRMKHWICLILVGVLLLPCFSACGDILTNPSRENSTPDGDTVPIEPPTLPATVVINELCADNKGSVTIGGEHYDWIELYNTTDEAQNISGWTLSDSYDSLDAYTLPAGTVLEAGGYLVVMAVGAEAAGSWQNVRPAAPFKLSEDGETLYLSDRDGALRDMIDYPAVHIKEVEITYARLGDGDEVWGEADPTPNKTNQGSSRVLSPSIMSFSHESGFYDDAFSLSIDLPSGFTVYYTTDCSDPQTSSSAKKWNPANPIRVYDKSSEEDTFSDIQVCDGYMYHPDAPVDKCFIVRAYVMSPDRYRSRTITKTYFVGYDNKDGYTNIPVLTLTADPYDLYDDKAGLFVAEQWGHDASVNRQEITADMTYMDENGSYVFAQKVGMRIRGTSTRGKHQKNLNIFARSRYDGNSSFVNPLFDDVERTKSFVLRNDGMDRLTIGQGFMQELASSREISTQDYYPVAVFLDGEYYGIYNLYERFSEDYVEEHYGVDSKDTWIVKKGGAPSAIESNCTAAGNDYTALMHFICNVGEENNDLSDPATYAYLASRIDMQSLADLLAVQLYIGNEDFSIAQNITAWRSATVDPANPYADGKWRFVIYDLDYTLDCSAGDNTYSYDYNPFTQPQPYAGGGFLNWCYNWNSATPFTRNLLKSHTFTGMLASTFESVARTDFAYARVDAEMERCLLRLLPNMENYVARYHKWYDDGAETLEADFYANTRLDRDYLRYRADYFLPYMRSALNITPVASLPPSLEAWRQEESQSL